MTKEELFDKVLKLLKGPEEGYIDYLQTLVDISGDYLNIEELKELAKSDPFKIARNLIEEIVDERYFVTDSDPVENWKKKHPGKMTFKEWLKENYDLDIITYSDKPEGYKRRITSAYDYYLYPEDYEEVEYKDSLNDNLKSKIKKVFEKKNDSKIVLFENDGDFVESFDDGDIDFSKLKTYEDKGNLVASFMITGGLNGSGEWKNYLNDLEKLLKELEKENNYKATIYQINTDVTDDVWNAMILLHNQSDIKDSLHVKTSDIINKTKEGYIIYSEKGKRLSKAFKTRKEAEERLKEIEMFKHMKKDSQNYYIVLAYIVTTNPHKDSKHQRIDSKFGIESLKEAEEIANQFMIDYGNSKNYNPNQYLLIQIKDGNKDKLIKTLTNREKKIKDSYYKGYDIEYKGDYYQVWIDKHDGDIRIAGDFPSEEEAMEWIDYQSEKQPVVNNSQNNKLHKYDVYYVDYANDVNMVEPDVLAKSPADAKRIVKKMYGNAIYGYPHDAILVDSRKEIKDNMMEEVKRWLEKYLVKKDDPNNKLGKTHIRPLKGEEELPKGVYHKAATDTSGIIHYKGGDYYWYLDKDENIHVERHINDSSDKRFACESYFDIKGHGLEDRMETNDPEKAKEWIIDKANLGYVVRIVDKKTGEVLPFEAIEDLEELVIEELHEPEGYNLWIVEWYDKRGNRHTIEFDSKEDAEEVLNNHQDDEEYNEIKIVEQKRYYEDSLPEEKHIVKFITYTQFAGDPFDPWGGSEIEEDEEIEEEYSTLEEAEEAANEDSYGTKGQYVEVYLDNKYYRDYEV